VQPAAGDAGGALGAALFVWHQLLDKPRHVNPLDSQHGSLLGPEFSPAQIEKYLIAQEMPFRRLVDEELFHETAELLAAEKVVGWFRGRMEFGPRALGARSILADARSPQMQSRLNQKIKFRESFRPFAPAVLAEHAAAWFDLPRGQDSPYMLLTAPVYPEHRVTLTRRQQHTMNADPDLCRRVQIARSTIPAVTHVDYSARLQTVDAARHPDFHQLLSTFHSLTGCPVLVNTSFNVRGEPMVCTPQDALRCFLATDMDALVLEDCLLLKSEAGQIVDQDEQARYVSSFQAD
jgi:carbamoyltransferase